jgi:hypothetical protein
MTAFAPSRSEAEWRFLTAMLADRGNCDPIYLEAIKYPRQDVVTGSILGFDNEHP